MKTFIIGLIMIIVNNLSVYSQEINNSNEIGNNKTMQQIQNLAIDNIMKYQAWNRASNNYVFLKQTGEQNKANIKQYEASGTEFSNLSFNIQSGNCNELAVEQIGNGNILFSSQLGYLATNNTNKRDHQTNHDNKNWQISLYKSDENAYFIDGERNKMNLIQNGDNNLVQAVQQGTDNSITSTQEGNNNNLLIFQKGVHNTITGYKQQNKTEYSLFDKIIQLGENNYLETNGVSNGGMVGNTFTQTGNNLSLKLNNELLNNSSGIEINQKGTEMKVNIEQSFFSFPMK